MTDDAYIARLPKKSALVSSSEVSPRARGMLLAAKSFYIGGKKWVNPYVTDGLVFMLDGIWNQKGGVHSADTTTWDNLVGNDSATLIGNNHQWKCNASCLLGGTCWKFETPQCAIDCITSADAEMTVDFVVRWDFAENKDVGSSGFLALANPNYTNSSIFTPCYYGLSYDYKRYVRVTFPFKNEFFYGDYADQYRCLAVSGSTSRYNVYEDGRLGTSGSYGTSPYKTTVYSGASQSFIGRYWEYASSWATRFSIEDVMAVRIYNRALSSDEIAANHSVDKARFGIA